MSLDSQALVGAVVAVLSIFREQYRVLCGLYYDLSGWGSSGAITVKQNYTVHVVHAVSDSCQ